ncbi:MAG: LysM peptidoglycan-binding domain-containing protein [Bacillota bacterium]|jgi:peptidoglycan endopeptidase LytF|nr:LysM peptidoglycan-binding domain-containing protein [Bacillota bacterium]HPZ21799.1 LysM peptidoglycan-binding domain-containing protein [Bacillota bacterium]HQD19393.1 LysM peptidoglycan-binding domain-containing protein [Bacillota bacterium]
MDNKYVAKKGESLYLIARSRGMDVRQLAQANPGVQNVFDDLENQEVVFPSQICPNGFLYTIQAGDTFFLLAQRFNTTVAAIQQANPAADPNNLRIGQVICIPQAGPPACSGFLYTIQPGDTFFSLAQRFGTTVNAIQQANPGVNPNNLQIGQVICIPQAAPPACSGFLYTIQPGDTYFLLAQRFGTTVNAIQQANPGVNPNNLQIGQVICIPQAAPPACSGFLYTIQPGDTYFLLAQRFGTTVNAIQQANPGVNPNNLQIGQVICIPA